MTKSTMERPEPASLSRVRNTLSVNNKSSSNQDVDAVSNEGSEIADGSVVSSVIDRYFKALLLEVSIGFLLLKPLMLYVVTNSLTGTVSRAAVTSTRR